MSPEPARCEPVKHPKTAAERKRAQRERQRSATRTDERQLAIACAEELKLVAAKFPAEAQYIYKTIDRILADGQRTKDRDRDAVVRAVFKQGCWTPYDVSQQTGLPRKDCKAIMEGLVAVKELRKVPRGKVNVDGPVEWLYKPTGEEPSTLMVLP